MESLFETYVLDGGPLMVVLLLCSLILVAIVIRDLIRFRPDRVMPKRLAADSDFWKETGAKADHLEKLKAETSPLGRVLVHVLERREERIRMGEAPSPLSEQVEDASEQVADDLYEDLGPLSTIYTVAPLLGLLGTILGMMSAFREYAQAAERDLSVLSQGIQQALVTTLWGLAISILAYVAARYFEARIRRFERETLPPHVHGILEKIRGETDSGQKAESTDAAPSPSGREGGKGAKRGGDASEKGADAPKKPGPAEKQKKTASSGESKSKTGDPVESDKGEGPSKTRKGEPVASGKVKNGDKT